MRLREGTGHIQTRRFSWGSMQGSELCRPVIVSDATEPTPCRRSPAGCCLRLGFSAAAVKQALSAEWNVDGLIYSERRRRTLLFGLTDLMYLTSFGSASMQLDADARHAGQTVYYGKHLCFTDTRSRGSN